MLISCFRLKNRHKANQSTKK